MEKKLGTLYQELAEKIILTIPVDWKEIHYLGEIEAKKASWSSVFYFKDQSTQEYVKSHKIPEQYAVSTVIYNQLLGEITEILLKIYDCFLENGQPAWEQFRLSIDSDGKFALDYLYDKINNDKLGQVERELIWANEVFGHLPKEGSYMRKLLDRCLKK